MKKSLLLLSLAVIAITACSKSEAGDVIDCLGFSFYLNAHHSAAEGNPKLINFNVTNTNTEHPLNDNIRWDFGDGNVKTVTGTTVSHTYAQPGTYNAKASVSLQGTGCSYDLKENVTISE